MPISCMYKGMKKNTAKVAKYPVKATRLPPAKAGSRKYRRSSTGSSARRSTKTKATAASQGPGVEQADPPGRVTGRFAGNGGEGRRDQGGGAQEEPPQIQLAPVQVGGLRQDGQHPDQRHHAGGHVEHEHRPPRPDSDQGTPDDRSGRQGQAGDRGPHAQRLGPLARGPGRAGGSSTAFLARTRRRRRP